VVELVALIPGPLPPIQLHPSLTALRPDDLLSLRFTWSGLTLQAGKLLRDPNARAAFLVVELEPQHVIEQAYFEFVPSFKGLPDRPDGTKDPDKLNNLTGSDPPLPQPGERVPARLARRSRLAFQVPPSVTEIPCTLEGLLRAMSVLPLSLEPRAQPPPQRGQPQQPPQAQPSLEFLRRAREPTPEQTSIEAPWRLVISPNRFGAWLHSVSGEAVRAPGSARCELWHTRLGVRAGTAGEAPTVIHDGRYTHVPQPDGSWRVSEIRAEPVDYNRTVRAIWSPDYTPDQNPEHDPDPPKPKAKRKYHPFRAALDPRDRHELVRLTSTLVSKNWDERTVDARRLMLSSLGAWLDLDYRHDRPAGHDELTIESWRHRAAMGRDTYVRVVYAGYLCPFRHRASLVKVTERKFESSPAGTSNAVLRQRMYVVVRQHEVFIPVGERRMPFRTVRITTRTTPNLDPPESDDAAVLGTQSAFCPHVGGQPFLFHLLAEDWEGRPCDFTAPLIFLDTAADGEPADRQEVIDAYNTRDTDGEPWRVRTVHCQKVAFAESGSRPGSTTLETETIEFGAREDTSERPRFMPEVRSAQVHIPAVEQLIGAGKATKLTIDDAYVDGWTGTPVGEVFARLDDGLPMKFKADRSGGVATPSINIGGLSRRFGPVGGSQQNVGDFNGNTFDPAEYFKGVQAKILGGIDLFEIVQTGLSVGEGNVPVVTHLPQGPDPLAPTAMTTQLKWTPPVTESGPYKPHAPPDAKPSLRLECNVTKVLTDDSDPTTTVEGELNAFDLNLFGFVVLPFERLQFDARPGEKMHVSAELGTPTFGGPLEFVQELSEYLGGDGFSDPPAIEVTSEGIRSGFSLELPSLPVGVMTLQNISFGAALNIPFTGEPVRLRFAFCERERPFHLLIYCFGGGGFFAIDLGLDGVEMFEASLEFGAAFEVDLGVASGGVHVMAGIYYSWQEAEQRAWLEGYLRMGGELDVLGLVSLSLEFIMSLAYESAPNGNGVVWGEATLIAEIEVVCFSDSVEISVRREFGDPERPLLEDMFTEEEWAEYWGAFEAAA
jgi:hypothetical protein